MTLRGVTSVDENIATSFLCKPQKRRHSESTFCSSSDFVSCTPLPIELVGPTASLDIMERRQISLACWESNPRLPSRPAPGLVIKPTVLFQLCCGRHHLRNGQWFPDNVWGNERKLDVVSRRNESQAGLGCVFYGIFSQLGRALR